MLVECWKRKKVLICNHGSCLSSHDGDASHSVISLRGYELHDVSMGCSHTRTRWMRSILYSVIHRRLGNRLFHMYILWSSEITMGTSVVISQCSSLTRSTSVHTTAA